MSNIISSELVWIFFHLVIGFSVTCAYLSTYPPPVKLARTTWPEQTGGGGNFTGGIGMYSFQISNQWNKLQKHNPVVEAQRSSSISARSNATRCKQMPSGEARRPFFIRLILCLKLNFDHYRGCSYYTSMNTSGTYSKSTGNVNTGPNYLFRK